MLRFVMKMQTANTIPCLSLSCLQTFLSELKFFRRPKTRSISIFSALKRRLKDSCSLESGPFERREDFDSILVSFVSKYLLHSRVRLADHVGKVMDGSRVWSTNPTNSLIKDSGRYFILYTMKSMFSGVI